MRQWRFSVTYCTTVNFHGDGNDDDVVMVVWFYCWPVDWMRRQWTSCHNAHVETVAKEKLLFNWFCNCSAVLGFSSASVFVRLCDQTQAWNPIYGLSFFSGLRFILLIIYSVCTSWWQNDCDLDILEQLGMMTKWWLWHSSFFWDSSDLRVHINISSEHSKPFQHFQYLSSHTYSVQIVCFNKKMSSYCRSVSHSILSTWRTSFIWRFIYVGLDPKWRYFDDRKSTVIYNYNLSTKMST